MIWGGDPVKKQQVLRHWTHVLSLSIAEGVPDGRRILGGLVSQS